MIIWAIVTYDCNTIISKKQRKWRNGICILRCQAGQWQSFGKYDIFTVIYASNEPKSVLARNLEECCDNDKNSQSVFLSFECILARNCEGTGPMTVWMEP